MRLDGGNQQVRIAGATISGPLILFFRLAVLSRRY
jgi:hypothetical protein